MVNLGGNNGKNEYRMVEKDKGGRKRGNPAGNPDSHFGKTISNFLKKPTEIIPPEIPSIAPSESGECRHHWMIESPHGATSMGACRLCGEVREFRNSVDDPKPVSGHNKPRLD